MGTSSLTTVAVKALQAATIGPANQHRQRRIGFACAPEGQR
ncbi:MAG: hypothetical protein ABIZ09_11235 [Rhodoferax sp.]